MSEQESTQTAELSLPYPVEKDKEINILELFLDIWSQKKLVAICTVICLTISTTIAIMSDDIYESSALLLPSDFGQTSKISSLAGQLGGIASLAGIDMGSSDSNLQATLATLKSRKFIIELIHQFTIKPYIFPDSWDADRQEWKKPGLLLKSKQQLKYIISDEPLPTDHTPSDIDAYHAFFDDFLSISEDIKTGLVTISIRAPSAQLSQELITKIIQKINDTTRQVDVARSKKSIKFLREKSSEYGSIEIQQAIQSLIETELKTAMFASINEEYAFEIIDPPILPEEAISPKRLLICIMGLLIGLIGGAGLAILHSTFNPNCRPTRLDMTTASEDAVGPTASRASHKTGTLD